MDNNPLVKGIMKTERNGVIGKGLTIKAATDDDGWNEEADAAWKEEMIERPCDVTGRYNINQYIRKKYLAYRRDGDAATIFTDDGLWGIEGEQIGTPMKEDPKYYKIVNGLAFLNRTNRLLGYFVGKPSDYGYIKSDSYKKYKAKDVHFMADPERFSQSRGAPALTTSFNYIDQLCGYIDAELVAAKVNACFSMFISRKDEYGDDLPIHTKGTSSSGYDEDGDRQEKVKPGQILYGEPGESAAGIGQQRPGQMFDPFTLRMLSLIGRPLLMPLMLVTLDYSGATFMNSRGVYQEIRESWKTEQEDQVRPFAQQAWRWKIKQLMDRGKLTEREDAFRCEFKPNRWPYVDPYKQGMADKLDLENRTDNRSNMCDRGGYDFEEVEEQRQVEDGKIPAKKNDE